MTRQGAIDTGRGAAIRFGKPFVVYRLPLWPPDVYGVIAVDRGLPPTAQTFETFDPDAGVIPTTGSDQPSLF